MAKVAGQLDFHPLSFGDQNGRVFWHEGRLYRGIAPRLAQFYQGLINNGTVSRLVDGGLLVDTRRSDLKLGGYDLVLEHRAIQFVSYAFEWCALMLQAAAVLTLDLEIELSHLGLTLQDAHPWNVLFDGPRPYWVDFGSIVPAQKNELWRSSDEFCHFYLYPLLVMAEGHQRVARRMLVDSDDGVTRAEAVALTGQSRSRSVLESVGHKAMSLGKAILPRRLRGMMRRSDRDVSEERPAFLQSLREQITSIRVPSPLHHPLHFNESGEEHGLDKPRRCAVERVIAQIGPASMLEVAYESPFYSLLAARAGVPVVAINVDEMRVKRLFELAQRDRLPVLPLVMDFRSPSPAYGLCGQAAAPASERLACDVAVVLDATHILGVRYRLTFDQLARGLAMFSRRGALVDFVPGDDPQTKAWLENGDFSWYTAQDLKAALARHFASVEEINPGDRPIFWCSK